MELSLNISLLLVLLMGIVPSWHLPFKCHNWLTDLDSFTADTTSLSPETTPSGRKLGLFCMQQHKTMLPDELQNKRGISSLERELSHTVMHLNCMVLDQRVIKSRLVGNIDAVDYISARALLKTWHTLKIVAKIHHFFMLPEI